MALKECVKYYQLSQLPLQHSFVSELPKDPQEENFVRLVRRSCYSLVKPAFLTETESKPRVVAWCPWVAEKLLDLEQGERDKEFTAQVFGGFRLLDSSANFTYAQCYGGHQFGNWAGQLGDGRVICLGEYRNQRGERWDIQLKGAGKTPYGRFADGFAVLRSCIREFLASEALASLGIPSTRALCVVETGKQVWRDLFYDGNVKPERGAVLTRLAPSFIRFGNFELFAYYNDLETLRKLADYCIKHYFPEFLEATSSFSDENNRYALFANRVVELNAEMVAKWQAVGFVHGVMNTDNFSILGLTLDYGPFGFLDRYDPLYTPNSTDLPGRRYCYLNQAQIARWNCQKFVQSLISLYGGATVFNIMEKFDEKYSSFLSKCYQDKLGLLVWNEETDKQLVDSFLDLLQTDQLDYTNTWRMLSNIQTTDEFMQKDCAQYLLPANVTLEASRKEKWNAWIRRYIMRLREENNTDDLSRKERMNKCNPCYILRNYYLHKAIQQAENGNFDEVEKLLQAISNPFEERPELKAYSQEPPEWANVVGICVNSCSS